MNPPSPNGRAAEGPPTNTETLVLLCGKLSGLENGLELAKIQRSFQETKAGVRVEVVANLCHTPQALVEAAGEDVGHLVLGLCSSDLYGPEFQHQARQAGLDPLGVTVASLGSLCAQAHPPDRATGVATVLLAAAVAGSQAFPGSGPEHVKPRLGWSDKRMSRRALFTLPPLTYEPVASIRVDRCLSEVGCDLCIAVCPRDALSIEGGRATVDKSACVACGLCVTECPRDAIELPSASLGRFERELEALLTAPGLPNSEPRAILFVCDRNVQVLEELARTDQPYPARWLPISVPCTGMLTPGWILQSLALGAAAVAVMACGGECKFGQQSRTLNMPAYCHELLSLLGRSLDALRVLQPASMEDMADILNQPLETSLLPDEASDERPCLGEPAATAQALAKLSEFSERRAPVVLRHEYSPLGDVRIDVRGCTGCEACARVCPTDALASQKDGEGLTITFDPNRCTACSLCARWCPEDVVQVERITDLEALANGRTEVYRDDQVHCERCGVGYAPASMVRRIEQLLQGTGGASSTAIRRCPACRGIGIGSGPGSR